MCTVGFIPLAGGGYILGHNRDESRRRARGLLPERRARGDRNFIAPRDPLGGGTWIGANDAGVTLCLLNAAETDPGRLPSEPVSRGRILWQILHLDSIEAVRRHLDARREGLRKVRAFHLVAAMHGDAGLAAVAPGAGGRADSPSVTHHAGGRVGPSTVTPRSGGPVDPPAVTPRSGGRVGSRLGPSMDGEASQRAVASGRAFLKKAGERARTRPIEARAGSFRWDGARLTEHDHAGPALFVSSGYDQQGAELERGKRWRAFLAHLRERSQFDSDDLALELSRWLARHEPERGALSVCMHREAAASVSRTIVTASPSAITMHYHDGAPCDAAATEVRRSLKRRSS